VKKVIIVDINYQDDSYLVEFLLKKGYEVHGTIRRASVFTTERIDNLQKISNIFGEETKKHTHRLDKQREKMLDTAITKKGFVFVTKMKFRRKLWKRIKWYQKNKGVAK